MIKAIIFDMDGVLIEARDWHFEALNRALRLFGLEISRYDHLATFDGLPTSIKLKILSTRYHIPEAIHDFINDMKQRYTLEMVHTMCRPRFHHEYALSRLKSEGYRIAVASNSIRNTIEVMMQRAALDRYLEFIISNQDVARPKPDPEMYNLAVSRMGLCAQECLVVEDNENGLRAAQASGAHVLAVQNADEVTYAAIARRISECNGMMEARRRA